ncbi:Acyl-CoA reductase-like NAD-dependent aldehyde dehydrogenase OS=Ureibacillus acetophenoni OX=614649 GN=SAMN05877842_105108 PE=3 SV=1 [Ureibacillus acetophenoni]
MNEDTDMGPMISVREIERVEKWIEEAISGGAKIVYGGTRQDNVFYPTIVEDVNESMKLVCEEIFGPVIVLISYSDLDQVIKKANDSEYGLQSAVFTQDIDTALYVANKLRSGGVVINDGSTYRADLMPYGGIKASGIGKEGPKYAIKEMTYMKPVIINLKKR